MLGGGRRIEVFIAREPEDRRELEQLAARIEGLAGELAELRRGLELEHYAVVGLQERQTLIYRGLERTGAIPRGQRHAGAA